MVSVMFFILKIVFNENVNCSDMRSSNKKAGTRENQLTGGNLRGLL